MIICFHDFMSSRGIKFREVEWVVIRKVDSFNLKIYKIRIVIFFIQKNLDFFDLNHLVCGPLSRPVRVSPG